MAKRVGTEISLKFPGCDFICIRFGAIMLALELLWQKHKTLRSGDVHLVAKALMGRAACTYSARSSICKSLFQSAAVPALVISPFSELAGESAQLATTEMDGAALRCSWFR